jgi:hypothetical protein
MSLAGAKQSSRVRSYVLDEPAKGFMPRHVDTGFKAHEAP